MSARMLLHRAAAPAVLRAAAAPSLAPAAPAAAAAARMYATAPPASPLAKVSVLDNGLTVATEAYPTAKTATVGAWIGAGSRTDAPADSGLANLFRQVSLKGTSARLVGLPPCLLLLPTPRCVRRARGGSPLLTGLRATQAPPPRSRSLGTR